MTLNEFRAALNELRPQVLATEPASKARKINREARRWLRNCQEEAGSNHEGATAYSEREAEGIITGLRRALEETAQEREERAKAAAQRNWYSEWNADLQRWTGKYELMTAAEAERRSHGEPYHWLPGIGGHPES